MKIAIVHDQLQEFGGAERVLVALKRIYPDADVYTSFLNTQSLGIHKNHIKGWNIITSWADKIWPLKKLYSPFRFITPYLWESLNLNDYDLVISSSGSYMCKGVITRPETVHICYLHHPPRYLYYYPTAIEWQKYLIIKIYGHLINHGLRMWDYLSSQRVDYFIANSQETRGRIQKCYRRDSDVIYPPVSVPDTYRPKAVQERGYYITVSRLARSKHIDVIIAAANTLNIKLKVVGAGRDAEYLKGLAGDTVEFVGGVSDEEMKSLYAGARAFLFASVDEEFGIAPIEAMGYGVPVIAYASGGLIETVQEGKNGYLYDDLSAESLMKKISRLESLDEKAYGQMSRAAHESSQQYSDDMFKEHITKYVQRMMKDRATRT